jgi:hypothetical protein
MIQESSRSLRITAQPACTGAKISQEIFGIARTGAQPRLTKALARTLLIVIATGIFGMLIHKPVESALVGAAIRNAPTANYKHALVRQYE